MLHFLKLCPLLVFIIEVLKIQYTLSRGKSKQLSISNSNIQQSGTSLKLIAAQLTNETFRLLNLNRHNYKNGAKLSPALECPSQHFVTFTLYLCNYCNYCRVGVESRSKNIVFFFSKPFFFFFIFSRWECWRWPARGASYIHFTVEPMLGSRAVGLLLSSRIHI